MSDFEKVAAAIGRLSAAMEELTAEMRLHRAPEVEVITPDRFEMEDGKLVFRTTTDIQPPDLQAAIKDLSEERHAKITRLAESLKQRGLNIMHRVMRPSARIEAGGDFYVPDYSADGLKADDGRTYWLDGSVSGRGGDGTH